MTSPPLARPKPLAGLRVVLVDDSLLVRDGLASMLRGRGADVVGSAPEPVQGLLEVSRHRPDVVVLDMRMPPSFTDEGVLLAEQIRRQHPRTGILVLSQDADARHVERLLSASQRGIGYLLKDRLSDWAQLTTAIRRVAAGEAAVDPEVVEVLLRWRSTHGQSAVNALSDRERSVLAMMAEGLTNVAIAERMSIADRTVESHVRAVFTKLALGSGQTENRRVLAVIAYLRATG